jgi:DNA-directed RNA polymerase subunit RPC12/RpoP
MRCPQCHERIVKARDGDLQFYCKRLFIRKSDHAVLIACSNCGTQVVANPEIMLGLRAAILVSLVKE